MAEKHGARFRNIYFLLAASESLPGRPRCGELVASCVRVLLRVLLANSEFTVTLRASRDCPVQKDLQRITRIKGIIGETDHSPFTTIVSISR